MIAPGCAFLVPSDNGHAFCVVLRSDDSTAYVETQSGYRLSVPTPVVQAGQVLLGKFAEEVTG